MAKKPEQSLDVLGQSLLSQQSAKREKADKRRRRDQRKLMILGTLVAGQSLVNSALKKRAKEIKDLGEMSKYKSKIQAENLSFYSPIFQSMEGHDTYADWNKAMIDNPTEYRALQGHLSPVLMANAKLHIPGASDDKARFDREYRYLKDDITNHLVEQAYGKDAKSNKTYKELFSSGAAQFANMTDVDPSNRDVLYNFLTNTDQNSLDAYKARELNRRHSNLDTSIFNKEVGKSFLDLTTFGLLKLEKGESNPFKRISDQQSLIPESLQQVFDGYNVNQIIKKEFAANYATMRDEVEAFSNNTKAVESMEGVWANLEARVKRGTFMDFYSVAGSERRKGSGHRYTAHSESMIENVIDFVNDRLPVRTELINQSGALANMIGDPQRPKMKESIMDRWLELPEIKTLGITKGDQEYRQVLNQLDTVIGRQEFALDFVTSLSIRNEKVLGFEVDFSEIKSITEPKFEVIQENGVNKFEPSELYNSLSMEDKELHYNSYLQAILRNQTRSKNTPEQLRSVALQFMQDVPPPDGRTPEEIMATIFEPDIEKMRAEDAVRDASIRMGFTEPTPFSNPATLEEDQRRADERLAELFGEKKNLTDPLPSQITRATNLGIITSDIEQNVVESKFKKLLDFTSFAESRDRNNQVSSEGAIGYYQFIPNKEEGKQNSLNTAYNRLSRELGKINVDVPQDLIKMAEEGFVSLDNVSKESQSLLALSNYIEDTPFDIRTGERLSGQGSTIIKAYLKAAPGSVEEQKALEFLYYNVHHKPKKEGVGLTKEELKPIIKNFEKSYTKYYKL